MLDVVIPVYNEEANLVPSVYRLHAYLTRDFPYPFQITVADNASVDRTLELALECASMLACVRVLRLGHKGRGGALRAAWSTSQAQVLAYMDVDLSTDLAALLPLVAPLISGHSDLAIGTRLAYGSRVIRGAKREVISRSYNLLLRGVLGVCVSDAQCGFKAIRTDVASLLLPMVKDAEWFFDTELLVLAQRAGLRIHEVPVDWVDDPDSRVAIVPAAWASFKGVVRLSCGVLARSLPTKDISWQFGRDRDSALSRPAASVSPIDRRSRWSPCLGRVARVSSADSAQASARLEHACPPPIAGQPGNSEMAAI